MIEVKPSPTPDTRTCDVSKVEQNVTVAKPGTGS